MSAALDSRLARLRHRLTRRYALRDLTLTLVGAASPLVATLPADPDAPLDEMAAAQALRRTQSSTAATEGDPPQRTEHGNSAADAARATLDAGAHLPYWALLWPSGLALAETLLADPGMCRGMRTLELGCGLGMTATVALSLGARLTVSDVFPEALLFAEYNALRSAGRTAEALLVNWRTVAGRARLLEAGPFDLLLAADVLYEQEDIEPLLTLAPALLRPRAPFWLAEPGRKASRAFVERALALGWRDSPHTIERAWPPDGDVVSVTTHRFMLPS